MNPLPERLRTDVAVLGSGPGGSAAACLLAEAGREVAWLEEGPQLAPDSAPAFSREEMETKYRHGGLTVAVGSTNVAYVEGRCVGGGSEINSGLYHRIPPEILDEWRSEFQIDGLSDETLRPHFEANERELSVGVVSDIAPASARLRDGAAALGWKSLEVPRWFAADQKQTMTRTFVPRAVAAGTKLFAGVRAIRLTRRGQEWTIRTEQGATIEARSVIVACGAVQTPALLLRSGLAPLAGRTFHMHPTAKVVAQFDEVVNEPDAGVPAHQVKEFSPRISFGCSISSPPHLAMAMTDHPAVADEVMRDWRRIAIYYAMTRGGRGSVRPLPFFRDPLVRFRLSAADHSELAEGVRLLTQCLTAAGALAVYPRAAGAPLMSIHLFSSCPMGENPSRCVADSFGRVRGESNLYIADASLLPTPPGVNPQGTIMALVRRNIGHFLRS